jgi:ABC-type uncharacterized transport system ATPase subunit
VDENFRADGSLILSPDAVSSRLPDSQPVLEMYEITKYFGTLEALSSVPFSLRSGTLHALLGESGAGKTTLRRIAFGMIAPDAGEIHVEGAKRTIRSPRHAIALSIGMVHQHFMLVPAMTVSENVELGGRGRRYSDWQALQVVSTHRQAWGSGWSRS